MLAENAQCLSDQRFCLLMQKRLQWIPASGEFKDMIPLLHSLHHQVTECRTRLSASMFDMLVWRPHIAAGHIAARAGGRACSHVRIVQAEQAGDCIMGPHIERRSSSGLLAEDGNDLHVSLATASFSVVEVRCSRWKCSYLYWHCDMAFRFYHIV